MWISLDNLSISCNDESDLSSVSRVVQIEIARECSY